ncbi:hypothetical protein BH10BAC1_BH10BAC1_06100 [soil metagenome]
MKANVEYETTFCFLFPISLYLNTTLQGRFTFRKTRNDDMERNKNRSEGSNPYFSADRNIKIMQKASNPLSGNTFKGFFVFDKQQLKIRSQIQ